MRRPFVGRIAAAAGGSTAASRLCISGAPAVSRSASRRPRMRGSVPGNRRSSSTADTYSPLPPTTMGTAPREATEAMAARACSWNSATVTGWAGSQTSMRWCRTPPCSAGVGVAVPMSMPR